ncbi:MULTISPECIES: rod-binding protein [unclassified Sphingobium]|uniref:rod-binding protein n=1 Tax=unclassified Sphingobium TaxID=2611147 RepID=UPI0007F33D43|nr:MULTISPECIES: rod-binding protein [unclassified Sphingobium]OAN52567.1 flagellar biosynthesis protein FlgJ [Sphingobium sp. TCM1]WIW90886.1 rod-binding protein [Sphingobium sp. V4]
MADAVSALPVTSRATGSAAKVAREFEGVFAGQIAKIMMESVEMDGDFTGGSGESMFRGILAEQIGAQIAKGRGLGLASAVEAQIIRMQGGEKDAQ